MADANLSNLLKWGITNSEAAHPDSSRTNGDGPSARGLDSEALAMLMGGPSDADRMRESIAAIQSPEISLENKLVAFDNLEQLIESIDNANNLANLGLWMPLVDLLDSPEKDLRLMAAWCCSTAVQNNQQCQERLLALNAVPKLVHLALADPDAGVRKKAVNAISSESRNYQPGLDAVLAQLPAGFVTATSIDAANMDAVDELISKLRTRNAAAPQ